MKIVHAMSGEPQSSAFFKNRFDVLVSIKYRRIFTDFLETGLPNEQVVQTHGQSRGVWLQIPVNTLTLSDLSQTVKLPPANVDV